MARPEKFDSSYRQLDSSTVTAMIMQLFQYWQLTSKQQAALLSLSIKTNTTIARYKNGQSKLALNEDRDKHDRIGHLLAIHKYLRILFPHNRELAYQWPTTPNQFFEGKSPVDVIIEEGFLGLVRVRRYLEAYIGS